MSSWRETVRQRAGHRCEYCKVHSAAQCAPFYADHVHPVSRGGPDGVDNRAFSCPACNLSKSNHVTLVDPETGHGVPVFNPRTDRWSDHFRFEGYMLVGLTPIGRAMIAAFDLNSTQYIFIRSVEEKAGLFPPESG